MAFDLKDIQSIEVVLDQHQQLIDLGKDIERRQQDAIAIMRKHDIVIDNLDDKMQKYAFSLYSDLVDLAMRYRAIMSGGKVYVETIEV